MVEGDRYLEWSGGEVVSEASVEELRTPSPFDGRWKADGYIVWIQDGTRAVWFEGEAFLIEQMVRVDGNSIFVKDGGKTVKGTISHDAAQIGFDDEDVWTRLGDGPPPPPICEIRLASSNSGRPLTEWSGGCGFTSQPATVVGIIFRGFTTWLQALQLARTCTFIAAAVVLPAGGRLRPYPRTLLDVAKLGYMTTLLRCADAADKARGSTILPLLRAEAAIGELPWPAAGFVEVELDSVSDQDQDRDQGQEQEAAEGARVGLARRSEEQTIRWAQASASSSDQVGRRDPNVPPARTMQF